MDYKKAEFVSEYEGTKFYFCSAGCKASFNRDPIKYMHK
ncbi:MAG: YHS domain-containing protein [Nitrososphaerales archaeon]